MIFFHILAVTCPGVSTLNNGTIVFSDPTIPRGEESTVTYSCNTGYGLTGEAVRTCTSSGWNGTEPRCEGVYRIVFNEYQSRNYVQCE